MQGCGVPVSQMVEGESFRISATILPVVSEGLVKPVACMQIQPVVAFWG